MAAYKVPASLVEDYLSIKTHLSREWSLFYLAGNSSVVSYRLACKKLKKKVSKTPRNSAHAIQTNSNVFRFITKANEIYSAKALVDTRFSFQSRLEFTQQVIEIGIGQMRTGEKTNGSDILKAIEIQNVMLGTGDRFKEKNLEELYRLAGEKVINND